MYPFRGFFLGKNMSESEQQPWKVNPETIGWMLLPKSQKPKELDPNRFFLGEAYISTESSIRRQPRLVKFPPRLIEK
jgi:hypothetical protein